jgi:hypothetical protein
LLLAFAHNAVGVHVQDNVGEDAGALHQRELNDAYGMVGYTNSTLLDLSTEARAYGNSPRIGLQHEDWLSMAVEVEFWATNDKISPEAAATLEATNNQDVEIIIDPQVPKLMKELNHTLKSVKIAKGQGDVQKMRKLNIKKDHEAKDVNAAWNLEVEDRRSMQLELASPTALTEKEAEFAMKLTHNLEGEFESKSLKEGRGSATHIHIQSKCLTNDNELRLVALILIWERFHPEIVKLFKCQRHCLEDYAASIKDRSTQALRKLQDFWEAKSLDGQQGGMTGYFTEFEKSLPDPTQAKVAKCNFEPAGTGLRNFAVNVCHLLDVNCCKDCSKNDAPKFGAIEFRVFKGALGNALQAQVSLVQRLVQASCTMDIDKLDEMVLKKEHDTADSAEALFKFLKLDYQKIPTLFAD